MTNQKSHHLAKLTINSTELSYITLQMCLRMKEAAFKEKVLIWPYHKHPRPESWPQEMQVLTFSPQANIECLKYHFEA